LCSTKRCAQDIYITRNFQRCKYGVFWRVEIVIISICFIHNALKAYDFRKLAAKLL